jgi:hypothetical protein
LRIERRKDYSKSECKVQIDTKLQHEDSGSYAKFFKNETKTAAYLGFVDLAEFRKFRFCTPVLEAYLVFHENCQNRTPKSAIQLLRDIGHIDGEFGTSLDTLLQKYPIIDETKDRGNRKQNTKNRDNIYAGIIYHLTHKLEAFAQNADPQALYDQAVSDGTSITVLRGLNIETRQREGALQQLVVGASPPQEP